jgi:hypothetical protein
MAALRESLGHDWERTVTNLRTMTDWRQLVRHYPWACLGAAAALGFVIVPSKANIVVQADSQTLSQLSRQGGAVRVNAAVPAQGAIGSLATIAGQMLFRAATGYVGQRLSAALSGASAGDSSEAHSKSSPH